MKNDELIGLDTIYSRREASTVETIIYDIRDRTAGDYVVLTIGWVMTSVVLRQNGREVRTWAMAAPDLLNLVKECDSAHDVMRVCLPHLGEHLRGAIKQLQYWHQRTSESPIDL